MRTRILAAMMLAGAAGSVLAVEASSQVGGESTVTLTGKNGVARVADDTIETRNGQLMVNGVPYGSVDADSVVKYTVRGKDRVLTVNGVPRAAQTAAPSPSAPGQR